MDIEHLLRGLYPYADKYGVVRTFPEKGLSREEVLEQIDYMATKEDATWEDGSCSGTMYCGDHDHYDFLNKVSARYSHVNSIQRDMCLSMSRFESEIIAMTLDMMHGSAVEEHHPISAEDSERTRPEADQQLCSVPRKQREPAKIAHSGQLRGIWHAHQKNSG